MTTVSYPPADGDYLYPFDPTGTAVSNKIVGELKTLSPGAQSDFFFVIPDAAPFFRESLKLVDQASGVPLVEGVDYICTHKFLAASQSIGKPVYGSWMMLNRSRVGVIKQDYQTVGGAWTLNSTQIAILLANTAYNPATTSWDQIQDLPFQFPPINHSFDISNLKGFESVVDSIDGLADAITGTIAGTSGQVTNKGLDLVVADTLDILMADKRRDYFLLLTEPNVTLTIDTPTLKPGDVRHVELVLYQSVGGSQVVWPDNIRWATGAIGDTGGPELSADKDAFDVVILKYVSDELGWLGYIAS